MHELSLCADLMDQVTRIAEAHHAQKVLQIFVRIGPLSGIEPHLLKSAFSISCAGTLAAEAELQTEVLTVRVLCQECGVESEPPSVNNLICGSCGAYNTKLIAGDELILAHIELEDAE